MEVESRAKEIGRRCKRIRNAKGWSCEKLGELIHTSAQNISKYEREGISNIDTIEALSHVFEQSLLVDEVDQEGIVGEVGKEILHLLIEERGFFPYVLLSSELYGMSDSRVSNEIFKLERIGLCVREQFKNWHGNDQDFVFITAKGIVTYKNTKNYSEEDDYDDFICVESYEQIIGEYDSYQDYIDMNPLEKIVRNINYSEQYDDECKPVYSCHRINYVKYLINRYEHGIGKRDYFGEDDQYVYVTGVNIYHDILYRMCLNLTDEVICRRLIHNDSEAYFDYLTSYLKSELGREDVVEETLAAFEKEFIYENEEEQEIVAEEETAEENDCVETTNDESPEKNDSGIQDEWMQEAKNIVNNITSSARYLVYDEDLYNLYDERITLVLDYLMKCSNDLCQKYFNMNLEEYTKNEKAFDSETIGFYNVEKDELRNKVISYLREMAHVTYDERFDALWHNFDYKRPEGASKYPIDWFTYDEIKTFIEENFGPAVSEEDKKLDAALAEINRMDSSSLDYYRFPKEWEQNGLADLVRKNCGIDKIIDE